MGIHRVCFDFLLASACLFAYLMILMSIICIIDGAVFCNGPLIAAHLHRQDGGHRLGSVTRCSRGFLKMLGKFSSVAMATARLPVN